MQIAVYNFKGGVGKTSIALNIALTCNFGVVTNDVYSPLESILTERQYIKVEPDEELPEIPSEVNIIYDLGGHIDRRAVEAIKRSSYVIVPVTGDYINIQVTIDAIAEIERYNKKIVVIGNRVKGTEIENIRKAIGKFYKYFISELKESKAFSNIFEEKKSIRDMVSEGGLKGYHYKLINNQFNELLKYIGI